jgi:hypothetical protein
MRDQRPGTQRAAEQGGALTHSVSHVPCHRCMCRAVVVDVQFDPICKAAGTHLGGGGPGVGEHLVSASYAMQSAMLSIIDGSGRTPRTCSCRTHRHCGRLFAGGHRHHRAGRISGPQPFQSRSGTCDRAGRSAGYFAPK